MRHDNETPEADDDAMFLIAFLIAVLMTIIAVTWGLPR